MSLFRPLLLCAALAACRPSEVEPGSDEPSTPTDLADSGPTDTGAPTTTDPADPVALSAPTHRLHERIGSIVYVGWEQSGAAAVHLEYSFDPGEWLSSPSRELRAGAHEELLLGIPFGAEVTYRVVATNGAGTAASPEATVAVGPLDETIEVPEIAVSDPSGWDPETRYVLLSVTERGGDFDDGWWLLFVDRKGRPVWALRSPPGRIFMHPQPSWDGTSLLVDHNGYWGSLGSGRLSTVRRLLIDGTELEFWETPGLHHPFTQLPDGTIAYGAIDNPYGDETLVEVRPDRSTEVRFSCEDWLAEIGERGYCGSNTLRYDPASDTYLFSFFSLDSILEIDASTGEVRRSFGHVDGSYAFDPPESAFWWQHGGHYLPNGHLLTSTDLSEDGEATVVREYEVDAATETLREVWSFGIEEPVYGDQMGEAYLLGNGNVLHNYGMFARIREAKPDGTVVWDLIWRDHDLGRSTAIADLYAFAPTIRP